jgi:predicted unusual protein kinase regulating ubiquinone biosynthesis (AarF/ABC1/UbiB family)
MYQIHILKKVHADPHPETLLVNKNNELVALDFGCMKPFPMTLRAYFELIDKEVIDDKKRLVLNYLN